MGIRLETIADPDRSRLRTEVVHAFGRFVCIVELTTEATVLMTHARMAGEAACHLLLLEGKGLLARDGNPKELVQEVRKATRELAAVDDKVVALLDTLVALGNYGSHFEPGRTVGEDTLATVRTSLRDLRGALEKIAPLPLDGGGARAVSSLRFAVIRLTADSLWWPAHRLRKLPWALSVGFHQIPDRELALTRVSRTSRTRDPVLDITVQNTRGRATVVDRFGFLPQRVWTDLKGLPAARRIRRLGRYVLPLTEIVEGTEQWLDLPDPIEISGGGSARFEVQLLDLRKHLKGNELIAQLLVAGVDGIASSTDIYFGVY